MNLTKSQQSAIDIRDSSLIISAGAGSGKTAVLTERILRRISDVEDDCCINDFLVVTFTNAAAKELGDRLRKKLSEKAQLCPENKKISKNLALMPLAKISTINSFCYELVRTNFHKLDLSANVRMADEAEISVIRNQLMNEVVDEAFDNYGDDESFITAYEIFSGAKNDNGFVDTLLRLDVMLSNIPDRSGYIKGVLESYGKTAECEELFDSPVGKLIKEETEHFFINSRDSFLLLTNKAGEDDALSSKYLPAIESEYDFARLVLSKLEDGYDEVRQLLDSYKPKSLAAVKGECDVYLKENLKNAKNRLCTDTKSFVSQFFCCDSDVMKKAAGDTQKVLKCLFDLVQRFEEKLVNRKKQLGILEFSDAERLSLKLLVESMEPFSVTPLAKSLREKYKEVYIDEYQDVNPLQDAIFRAISRTDGEHGEYTRFMVGDIKQSIYRFRGASPDIFMKYRDSFSDVEQPERQKRIFMSHNFRCSESVINVCNYLFKKLMGNYFSDGDILVYARQEAKKVSSKVQFILAEADREITCDRVDAEELEAALIAEKIKETVNNPLYSDSDGRLYGYGDVAVLTRSKSSLKIYERVFAEKGIPVFSEVGESFFGKKEVLLCLCVLKAIDNPMQDIPLAGVMRSFVGKFTDDELCIIKHTHKNLKLYNSVKRYGLDEDGKSEPQLKMKCLAFIEYLQSYRNFARGKSVGELMWNIYTNMGIMDFCVSEGFTSDGKSAKRNLLKLYEMALDFDKTAFRGLGAFVDYINSSMEKDDIKAERVVGGESVRLMTVHASKGLEFPVCFVSDTARKFNKTDERQHLVFSGEKIIACSLCDSPSVTATESSSLNMRLVTPYKNLAARKVDEESMQEEIRILYVALTRARDYLFITGITARKPENLMSEVQTSGFLSEYNSSTSYLTLIMTALSNQKALLPVFVGAGIESPNMWEDDLSDVLNCSFVTTEKVMEMYFQSGVQHNGFDEGQNTDIDENYLETIKKLSSFEYSYSTSNPAKLTVSMLKKGLIEDEMSDLTENVENKSCENDEKSEILWENELKTLYNPVETVANKSAVSVENRVQKKVPDYIAEEKQSDGAEKGTAMHMFMQFARFEECESEQGCRKEAQRLTDMQFITEKQQSLLDYKGLCGFFANPIYCEIKNSTQLYREQRFNLEIGAFDNSEDTFDCETLVQGVIDLFYRNPDGTYTVLDFKTDRVFGKDAENTLVMRHKQQLMYYCRAVEQMTGEKVSKVVIYSFALDKCIEVKEHCNLAP